MQSTRRVTSCLRGRGRSGASRSCCVETFFHHEMLRQAREARPDLLLVPFARHVDEDITDLHNWPQEREVYARQLQGIDAPALPVNHLDDRDGRFGGSFAVGVDGQVTAAQPLHTEGVVIVEFRWR